MPGASLRNFLPEAKRFLLQESAGLPQTIAFRKNTAAHNAPGPGQGPGHGAVRDSNTPGNVFLPGIPTDSWAPRV